CQIEAALLRIERGHCARAVDADEPVGFRAAFRRVRQREQFAVASQILESFPDGGSGHRLQPKPLDRLLRSGVLKEVAKNELTLPACVASIDQSGDVLPPHQLQQRLKTLCAALDGREI